ncbi:MAG: asparagine--tRNA ligase [Candidatus Westeberhardia cardiocondylae]|nr:asparagine--tRNA ligase [Candidatus Westeberhardia cardiocondylae]
MEPVSIKNILRGYIEINSTVIVQGWIRTKRNSKIGISFIVINDGSCLRNLQIIANTSLKNYTKDILLLTTGCAIKVFGNLKISPNNNQKYEIQAIEIKILGWIDNPKKYPISSKYHTTEYLREHLHLRPRTNLFSSITRIRHIVAQSIHKFMHKKGFYWIATPLITSIDTEGFSKMFCVSTLEVVHLSQKKNYGIKKFSKDFFGKKTFLTVSGQLAGESYACSLSKIYTFGPTFRAEHSNTRRHLSEFWMIEPEMAFATLNDIIELAKKLLQYIAKEIVIHAKDDIQFLFVNKHAKVHIYLHQLICEDFVHISYTEAINVLKKSQENFNNKILWGMNLNFEHECYLTEKYYNKPVIITDYPKDIKAFYMRCNNDLKTVAAMDILVPGIGEIIGGGQREERLDKLDKSLKNMGLEKNTYQWYRELRKYGTVPHSGFGLGLERLIMYVTGVKNIRDVIPFPRTFHNADF